MQTQSLLTASRPSSPIALHDDRPLSPYLASRVRNLISAGAVQLRSIDGQDTSEFMAIKSP